nr:Chain C, A-iCAL36 peptide [synthetic construct]4JOE_D Chain D, A-iCAL36 peptide [synthetic construct]
ANSRAPTSII